MVGQSFPRDINISKYIVEFPLPKNARRTGFSAPPSETKAREQTVSSRKRTSWLCAAGTPE